MTVCRSAGMSPVAAPDRDEWIIFRGLSNAAVALAIVGSNDPTGTVAFALTAIMMFQAGQPKVVILFLASLNGTIAFVAASVVLVVPTANIATHTWIFASTSAIAVAVVRFLVKEQQQQRKVATGLAVLARETATAQTVAEGIAACAPTIRSLTGPPRCGSGQRMTPPPSPTRRCGPTCSRGVGNRLLLQDRLRSDARAVGLTAVMLDLDHFKAYNDRRGHLAGDQLLHSFAEVVAEQLRHPDVVVRWGGEESCLLVHGSLDEAEVI